MVRMLSFRMARFHRKSFSTHPWILIVHSSHAPDLLMCSGILDRMGPHGDTNEYGFRPSWSFCGYLGQMLTLESCVSWHVAKPAKNAYSCCIKATKTPAPSVPFTAYGVFCQILKQPLPDHSTDPCTVFLPAPVLFNVVQQQYSQFFCPRVLSNASLIST